MADDKKRKAGHISNAIAIPAILLALAVPVTLVATRGGGYGRHRVNKCMWNLRQIGLALHVYATDHDDRFPASLGSLFPTYLQDGRRFICTSSGNATLITESDLPEGAQDASTVLSNEHTDYTYIPGLSPSRPPTWVVAFDKKTNHEDPSGGRNVVCIDGHVEWMPSDGFETALQTTLDGMRERGIALPAAIE